MINLSLTDEAQQYVRNGTPLHFTTFIASSSFDYEDMEAYRKNQYQGDATFLKFPIAYLNITPKGYIYSIGHESYTLQETLVDIVGALEAYKATKKFEVNSIGIIAKYRLDFDDDDHWGNFIFAFGSLELNTYPLPVIAEDSMTFIIPFQVSYGSVIEPHLTAPDILVPWKTFNEHNYEVVTNPMQTHDLWVDLQGMKFRVESTTFPIPVGSEDDEARLDAIEEELEESALYSPSPAPSNSEFASVSLDGDYIEKSTVKVSSVASSATKSSLEAANQSIRSITNSIIPVSLKFGGSFSVDSGWTTDGDIKYKDVITSWITTMYLPFKPINVTLIPSTQYPANNTKWYDYGLWYDIVYPNRYKNEPFLRIYANANTVMSGNVYYRFLMVFDPVYYTKLPITVEYRTITLEHDQAKWDGYNNKYTYYFDDADTVDWVYPLAYIDDPTNEDVITYGIRIDSSRMNEWRQPSSNSPYTWCIYFLKNSSPTLTNDVTLRIRLLH